MADLSGVLGRVPGLAGYLGARQIQQQEGQAELQQATSLMGLLSAAQQQQARAQVAQKEQEFRGALAALGPNATQEQLARVAAQFGNADTILRTQQGSLDRQAQINANKEAIRQRLDAQARDLEFKYENLKQKATNDKAKLLLDEWYKRNRIAIDQAGVRLTGERVFYETGERPDLGLPEPGVTPQPQSGAVPPASNVMTTGAPRTTPTSAPAGFPQQQPRGAASRDASINAIKVLKYEQESVSDPQLKASLQKDIDANAQAGGLSAQEVAAIQPARDMSPLDTEAAPPPAPTTGAPAARAAPGNDLPEWIKEIKSPKVRAETATKWRMEKEKEGATGARITQTQIVKGLEDNYTRLRDAPQALANIEKAKALIPQSKLFQGSLGEQKLAAAKFFNNNLGMSIDMTGVQSAEELRSRVFFNIMDNLKKMDAQPSQLQQQIMQDALGKLGTDPSALGNILDAFGDVIRDKVAAYDKQVSEAATTGIKWPHKITIPQKAGGRAAPSPAVREFKSEAEAAAAGLSPGTKIKINGVQGTWQ